jgi:7-carboxy-7-deazaguanine synthase
VKLLEIYTSVQGEGPNVGIPTTFVRFAGCNMRCPGWPCDTPYAIFPDQWRHEFEKVTPHDLVKRCVDLVPRHVCITGGEPLLQPKDEIKSLVGQLTNSGFTIDLFSNGSRDLEDYGMMRSEVTIIMDWKLTGSGEALSFLDMRKVNVHRLEKKDAVKFVVKDHADFNEALDVMNLMMIDGPRVYFSPTWGEMNPADLVRWMEEEGLSQAWLNLQTHKFIWDPNQRAI